MQSNQSDCACSTLGQGDTTLRRTSSIIQQNGARFDNINLKSEKIYIYVFSLDVRSPYSIVVRKCKLTYVLRETRNSYSSEW